MTDTNRWYRTYLAVPGAALLGLAAACSGSSTVGSTEDSSALSSAYASSTASTGTLLCAPAQGQIDACTGKAAGDACTLVASDGGAGRSGACRSTIEGTALACAPAPRAPPQALVEACSGKAAGDVCQAKEAFGNTASGVCGTARDGTTLVCGRVRTPPQAEVDACKDLEAGAKCTMPSDSSPLPIGRCVGKTSAGICSLGPAGSGALACTPAQELLPPAAEACSNLAVGASCTLGRGHETASGTCVAPATGGDAICVVACAQVGGDFECGGRDDDRGRRGDVMGDGGCSGHLDAGAAGPSDAGPIPVN